MKKFLVFIYVALVSLFCTSCVVDVQYDSIPFTVNNVYYSALKNDKAVKNVYFSQGAFEKDFKPAVSGEESMGKLVDFEKSFVVTITEVPTETSTDIQITEVLVKDMGLHVLYKTVKGEKLGYKIHPCVVASISRNYMNYDIAFHDITEME